MKTIYKYVIPFMEVAKITLPIGAQIIRIDGVEGQLYMWAVVDPLAPIESRTFHLFKTGADMPDDINSYIYHGFGAIFIQQELCMYVYEDVRVPAEAYNPLPCWEWPKYDTGMQREITV